MNTPDNKKDVWTVKRILEWTTDYFESKGCDTPRLDSEVLLGYCLNLSRVQLYLNYERPLSTAERDTYRELVLRRASREPVSLIVGNKEFWSHPFKVLPGVLVPRPDTETLVEVVVNELASCNKPMALEIGVGSGAISVSVLLENPNVSIIGIDISRSAIDLSLENARLLGCADRFFVVLSDLTSAFRRGPLFNVIFSNPPYIRTSDITNLAPEIVKFDPMSALDGGADGLDFFRIIGEQAAEFLSPGGSLILETGDGQSSDVAEILETTGRYRKITFQRDLGGRTRVVRAVIR
jgi:release factor glutamine methyltransferase